ncbi:MAG TPA: outer membrane beta-barrel protein [Pyrinomonadaceae bacterium]|nr:outer membrane beta-barrel protein [Pyrinomonadaceae bacterium]
MTRFVSFLFGLVLFSGPPLHAQQTKPAKLEIGAQFTSLSLTEPGVKREVGVGGRVTYNFTDNLAVEGEVNFLPSGSTRGFTPGGSILQGQFGLKAGKRWNKFGVFAKARPGFVSFAGTFDPRITGTTLINGSPFPVFDFDSLIRSTHFSMDLGGVAEIYPSRRVIVRFDAGDTVIHYGALHDVDFSANPPILRATARTTHNFQLSAGVGFRLLAPKDEAASEASGRKTAARSTPKFEIGAQFTSLTFNPPRQLAGSPVFFGENRPQTELGLGGRFTFNLTNFLALESVFNYFPTSDGVAAGATGRVSQGLFGVKAGKRFQRIGFFGKFRPGFVSFNRSLKLVGTEPFTFGGFTFTRGIFETGRRTFFANDFGGVLEFYPSRRWSVRFDAGDTRVHYGARSVQTIFVNPSFITAAPEKRHNFQFSSGFSFRF